MNHELDILQLIKLQTEYFLAKETVVNKLIQLKLTLEFMLENSSEQDENRQFWINYKECIDSFLNKFEVKE